MKILIIEDNDADRILLEHQISMLDRDIAVFSAVSGKDAIQDIKHENYDLIFLDYMLPDMDGVDVLKAIYDEKHDLGPCPVIMLTGQKREDVMLEAIRYGAQDYIIKDSISSDILNVTILKAQQGYDLRVKHNKATEQLAHAQRMEAVGQLTGGIAHDFNNLLTIILGNIKLLDMSLDDEAPDIDALKDNVQSVKGASERGANLVKQLMIFARHRNLEPQTISINDLIRDMDSLIQQSIDESIETDFMLGDDVWLIDIDPSQIEHTLINMIVNARDAMVDGGKLSIKTSNVIAQDAASMLPAVDETSDDYVLIEICDTGTGIAKDVAAKIFEPFFTTKDIGKGTGLGLSMAYGLVQSSGGHIDVQSEIGKGTCFRIFIPRSFGSIDLADKSTQNHGILRGSGTVLLVDDEHEIRKISVNMLKLGGYTVIEAENAAEAMDIIKGNADIDLLFTDIAMPGDMDGVALAKEALKLRQDMRVLFTTGHTEQFIPDSDLISSDYRLLLKPYEPVEMMQNIADILDAS